MKTLPLLLLLSLSLNAQPLVPVPAQPAKTNLVMELEWNPLDYTNGVTGYIIRHGTAVGQWTQQMFVPGAGSISCLWTNSILGATNYFVATSVNDNGLESDMSNVTSRELARRPTAPVFRRAVPLTVQLQGRSPGALWTNWIVLGPYMIMADMPAEQFRVVLHTDAALPVLEAPR